MNKIERLLLECFVAQVEFERDGILKRLWNKKLEVEEFLKDKGEQK